MQRPAQRILEIDLLRFVAAVAVVIFHWAFRGHAADGLTRMNYPGLEPAARYGYLGVELFFVISGFVILMSARSGSLRDFAVSRVVRLYPAFWFCCTLTFLVMVWFDPRAVPEPSVSQYLVNLTMFSGFLGVPSIDGAYWSLFVEMRFYLMVALVLALGWMPHVERLLWIWLVIVVLQRVVRTGPLWLVFNAEHAQLFIAGAVLYLVHESGWTRSRVALLLGAVALVLRQGMLNIRDLTRHYGVEFSPVVVACVLIAIVGAMSLAATGRLAFIRTRWWLPLGAITYPLYLLHQNLGYIAFDRWIDAASRHALFWSAFLTALALAYSTHRWVEKPIAGWLRRRLRHRRLSPLTTPHAD